MRRRLHRMIADATADPDERARHLAGCATTPDAVTAVALTDAARRQRFRGAPELAAELYERAAQLTPPQSAEEWAVRHLAAARCRFDCGDYAAAGASALAAAEKLTGDARAEALLLHAVVAWSTDDLGIAVASARQALAATTADTSLAGRIHAHLSLFVDEPTAGRQHAQAAVTLLSGDEGQRPLLSAALLLLLFNEVRGGLPARTELLDQALLLEENEPSWLAGTVPASWWKAIDEHDLARARLQRMLRVAADQGDEPWQHELLAHLGETELLAGQWDAAERHIAEARELGEQLGTGVVGETWLVGMLHAYRGNLAEAELIAESGLKRADSFGDAWCRRIHLQLAGFVELSAGRFAAAAATYGALAAAADDLGLVEPIALRFEPDWIEACVGCGDLDAAAAAFERLHLRHERLPRPWTTLGLARCRVLLDGARGTDTAPALAQLAEARAQVRADILPMDQARCLLIAGVAHRRARRRRQSREDLVAAAEGFRAIGALAFADRAETELARIGGRQSAPRGLTATEEMVARLAAAGRTNRVIADELFLSPKTVEANLARAYTKLGISSRAQLSAALTDRPPIKP
jgi:DNA-binding NarL/FixJ family response regulator